MPSFLTGLVLTVLAFLTEVVLIVLVFLTEFILTALAFLAVIVLAFLTERILMLKVTLARDVKDFKWLYGQLCKEHPKNRVPPIPTKKFFGASDPAYIVEWRGKLQVFANAILLHPMLRASLALKAFMGLPKPALAEAQRLGLEYHQVFVLFLRCASIRFACFCFNLLHFGSLHFALLQYASIHLFTSFL